MPASQFSNFDRGIGGHIFGADADGYHAARVGYPDALLDHLFARCSPPGVTLEIGPGTGLATQALLARGVPQLVAVEPDPALCQYLADHLPDPRLEIVRGDFVQAPLTGLFALAVCACSFHWLEFSPATARLRRVLEPGGVLALSWNVYRQPGTGDAFADMLLPAISHLPMPPSEALGGHHWLNKDLHIGRFQDAGFIELDYSEYRRERLLDAEA
ncbi:MAG: methyltransferase domain-containing protein, partial [Novosphingobium sp.]